MCRCNCPRSIRSDVIDYREPVSKDRACRICGGNPAAIVNAYKAGMQQAAYDTYASNIAATGEREWREAERQHTVRWSE